MAMKTAAALLASSLLGAQPHTVPARATLVIHRDRIIRQIPRELFGVNLEWVYDGSGLWDRERGRLFPDRLERVREIGFGSLRYPGGTLSDYFHWAGTIGNQRTPQINPFAESPEAENARVMPAFGAAEYLATCRALEARPWITCNVGTGTAEEAAAWARWCRDQGLEVMDWEVGNEVYLKPDRPDQVMMTPEQYAGAFLRFAAALREVNPSYRIFAIAQLPPVGLMAGGLPRHDWNQRILDLCGRELDGLATHHAYAPGAAVGPDLQPVPGAEVHDCLLGAAVFVRRTTRELLDLIRARVPDRADHIRLAVTEHEGLFYPLPDMDMVAAVRENRTLASALFLATLYNHFIAEPAIGWTHKMTLITPWFGGVLQSTLNPAEGVWPNPQFYVCKWFASCAGKLAVECEAESPRYSARAVGIIPALPQVPLLDASAVTDADGREVTAFLVNRSREQPLVVTVSIPGLQPTEASAEVLTGPSPDATNDPPHRETVKPGPLEEVPLGAPMELTLPPCSLTVVTLRASA